MKNVLDMGFFEYEIKPPEILWAVLQGGAAFLVALTTMPSDAKGWEAVLVGLGAAAIRPVFALVFGKRPTGGA